MFHQPDYELRIYNSGESTSAKVAGIHGSYLVFNYGDKEELMKQLEEFLDFYNVVELSSEAN